MSELNIIVTFSTHKTQTKQGISDKLTLIFTFFPPVLGKLTNDSLKII